jgi:dephospho-CoA kinase
MPILTGLTGGIGSGKTTVAKLFEELNIPVYYSDDEAKKLYENPDIQHQITEVAGPNLFIDRELNRPLLAKYMFASPEIRAKVNAIIHPQVRENFGHFCELNSESPYVINEAAILFETGAYKNFQFNILVVAPEQIRMERVMARDGISEESVKQRMKAQWDDEQKIPLADFIIQNDGIQSLKDQVMQIHEQLQKSANG